MKATKRAKRLERYLSEELGWDTKSGRYECASEGCLHTSFSFQNFCPDCGYKMPTKRKGSGMVFDELEQAIAYALEEAQ
jgi:hypothetical protein